jgi:hypothetical protein
VKLYALDERPSTTPAALALRFGLVSSPTAFVDAPTAHVDHVGRDGVARECGGADAGQQCWMDLRGSLTQGINGSGAGTQKVTKQVKETPAARRLRGASGVPPRGRPV